MTNIINEDIKLIFETVVKIRKQRFKKRMSVEWKSIQDHSRYEKLGFIVPFISIVLIALFVLLFRRTNYVSGGMSSLVINILVVVSAAIFLITAVISSIRQIKKELEKTTYELIGERAIDELNDEVELSKMVSVDSLNFAIQKLKNEVDSLEARAKIMLGTLQYLGIVTLAFYGATVFAGGIGFTDITMTAIIAIIPSIYKAILEIYMLKKIGEYKEVLHLIEQAHKLAQSRTSREITHISGS